MSPKKQRKSVRRSATLTIPELEQSKASVLNTLPSAHSRRSYRARPGIFRPLDAGHIHHDRPGKRLLPRRCPAHRRPPGAQHYQAL
jgi:hypothetical protein